MSPFPGNAVKEAIILDIGTFFFFWKSDLSSLKNWLLTANPCAFTKALSGWKKQKELMRSLSLRCNPREL
jgi:hypothetical protein